AFARRLFRFAAHPWRRPHPYAGLTRRQREVALLLAPLPDAFQRLLAPWLLAPTSARWPRPDHFSPQLAPFTPAALSPRLNLLPVRLFEEVQAIRQTLDMPSDAFAGLPRDLLLVVHGTRLRQLMEVLGENETLCHLRTICLLGPTPAPETPLNPALAGWK